MCSFEIQHGVTNGAPAEQSELSGATQRRNRDGENHHQLLNVEELLIEAAGMVVQPRSVMIGP
jgi:hypothetical protein